MITVSFYQLLSKGNGKDQGPIYMRVRGLDRRLNLSTGINEPSKDWDGNKERFKQRHPNAYVLNQQLDEMERKVLLYVEQKSKDEHPITPEGIKDHVNGKDEVKFTLLYSIDAFLNQHQSLAEGTTKQYRSTKKKLLLFLQSTLRASDIALTRLDYAFVTKWRTYLAMEHNNHPNTINKDITRVRTVINWTMKMDWLRLDPFRNYKSQTVPTVKAHLNLEDIAKIEQYNTTNPTKEAVRDTFLLMCYTGLSYSDLKKLKAENIQNAITGGKIIKHKRQKTMEYCMVPLIQKGEEIINKYRNHPTVRKDALVMPMISNQKTNAYLKEIKEELGITKKVTCHVGRHSFATNALELGVPIETVSKALGHRSIKTTQIYARVTEGKLNKDFVSFANGFIGRGEALANAI